MENARSNDVEEKTSNLQKPKGVYLTLLRVRRQQKSKKPNFRRQENWRYKRVGTSWRRPKGIDNSMRLKKKSRPKLVNVGYRSPRLIRNFHPSGFEERLIHNLKDLEKIEPTQVVRIGHTVGLRKRLKIIEKARELGIRILNTRGVGIVES